MSTVQIALLRGINVGRAKRVAMADLRALLEGLGCSDVRTLLNSGNAVFVAPEQASGRLGAEIEAALLDHSGVAAAVVLLNAAQLERALRDMPWPMASLDPSRLLLAFAGSAETLAQAEPLQRQDWGPERLVVGASAAYLSCPGGIAESPLARAVARLAGGGFTTRNWSTMLKLRAMVAGSTKESVT